MNEDIINFTKERLIPCADIILCARYQEYCAGQDIGIQIKEDQSPASLADLETEAAMRRLIAENFPNHGIWGEELGAENIDADYVWVLDPLDGTKAFLNKMPNHFGSLVGLLYKGNPVFGCAYDPISKEVWLSSEQEEIQSDKKLNESVLSCTSPDGMFKTSLMKEKIGAVIGKVQACKEDMNCIGFTSLINGDIDVAVENDLKPHDIIPLIPILKNAGMVIVDFDGNDYRELVFDLNHPQKYGVIASGSHKIISEILDIFQQKEAA